MSRTMNGVTSGRPTADMSLLREQVEEALERISRLVVRPARGSGNGHASELQDVVRFLGQVTAGWTNLPPEALPAQGAGFGSRVRVEDCADGTRTTYTLMAGPLLDIDDGQVSLASPLGQALLGASAGDVVAVETPQRRRTLRVVGVRTLRQLVDEEVLRKPAA